MCVLLRVYVCVGERRLLTTEYTHREINDRLRIRQTRQLTHTRVAIVGSSIWKSVGVMSVCVCVIQSGTLYKNVIALQAVECSGSA